MDNMDYETAIAYMESMLSAKYAIKYTFEYN